MLLSKIQLLYGLLTMPPYNIHPSPFHDLKECKSFISFQGKCYDCIIRIVSKNYVYSSFSSSSSKFK